MPEDTRIPQRIHDALKKMSKSSHIPAFRDPNTGLEWLSRAEGQGTHARATAKVVIVRGSGKIKVNGEEDFTSRWPHLYYSLKVDLVQDSYYLRWIEMLKKVFRNNC